jgi:hypothetical protein
MVVSRVGECSEALIAIHTDLSLEASPNKRAGCSSKECKEAGIKIEKGEFRYAIQFTVQEHTSWQYRHW